MARCISLVFLLVLGCGGRPLPEWKTDPTPAQNAKRIAHLQRFNSSKAWERSPYARLNDAIESPVYLIVAEDDTGCLAPVEDWTIAARGDFYPCPGQWRSARPT